MRERDGYARLFHVAAWLGVLGGSLFWILPTVAWPSWQQLWVLPFAAGVGALVGLVLAGLARGALAVNRGLLPEPLIAGVAVALGASTVIFLLTGGQLDGATALGVVVGAGLVAAIAVAARRRLRWAPLALGAVTVLLCVAAGVRIGVVSDSLQAKQQAAAAAAAEYASGPEAADEPEPVPIPTNARAQVDAQARAEAIRTAAGAVSWFASPAITGYPCDDARLERGVSYSFSGSFRTDPVAAATDPATAADVAAVQRIDAALTEAGFAGRPFASGTASTEYVGGDADAPEQLLIAHGGAVTSVTYVGACVRGD